MYVNIVLAEYFVDISTCTAKLVGKPCYSMPLFTKALLNKFSYVHSYNNSIVCRDIGVQSIPTYYGICYLLILQVYFHC